MTRRMWLSLLVGLLGLALAPAAPALGAPATAGSTAATQRSAYTMPAADFEHRLFLRTNSRRVARGCRPLRLNAALGLAARRHSMRMVLQRDLAHRLAGEADLSVRAPRAGYKHWRILAENLAWGQATPRQVFNDWVASPGHRANLDDCQLRDVGFAVVFAGGRPWVTADFGRHF